MEFVETELEQLPLVQRISASIEFTSKSCPGDMPLGLRYPFDQVALYVTCLCAFMHASAGTALNTKLSTAAPECQHASDTKSRVFTCLECAVR